MIALVITIIVLLILAGITINTLMGEGGILKQSTDAKSMTENAELTEEAQMVMAGRRILKDKTLKEDLEEGILGATVEEVTGATDMCVVTRNGQEITVYDNGDVLTGRTEIWDGTSMECPEFRQENGKWNWYIYTPAQLKFLGDFINNNETLTSEQETMVINAGYNTEDVIILKEDVTSQTATRIYIMNNLDLGARPGRGTTYEEMWETPENEAVKWTPIGGEVRSLGIVEGKNHTIKGMYVNEDGIHAALFGYLYGVRDLTIADSYVRSRCNIEGQTLRVAVISGLMFQGGARNCHTKNTTIIAKGGSYIGGMFRIYWFLYCIPMYF